jgi:maleylpyruvate isomerase
MVDRLAPRFVVGLVLGLGFGLVFPAGTLDMLGGSADTRRRPLVAGNLPRMTGFADDPLLDVITAEADRLLETIHGLDDEAVRHPSRCPGWTRGHVLTHVARNADGLRDVLRAATNGTEGAMYASQARRDSDIEDGAGRSASELESDVEISDDELLAALAETPPEVLDVRIPRLLVVDDPARQQLMRVRKVPLLRLRELVLHHIDLDAGYTLDDIPESFVLSELAGSAIRFTDEAPLILDAGDAGHWHYGTGADSESHPDGDAVTVIGTPLALFGWISGRGDTSGLTSSTGSLPQLPAWG